MANSNNSQVDPGTVFIFVIIGFAVLFMMALAALAAAVLTILYFAAWHQPLTMGTLTITPKEARWFVYRGCIGAVVLPFIVVLVFGPLSPARGHDPNAFYYVVAAGYTIGSLGIEYVIAQFQGPQQVYDAPPEAPAPPPAAPAAPKLPPQPFKYADWSDEERK